MFTPGFVFGVLMNTTVHLVEVDSNIMACSRNKFKKS